MDYRSSAPREGACPRCGLYLAPLQVEGAALLVCNSGCGGLFADVEASQRIMHGLNRQLLAVAHELAMGKPERDGGLPLSCPVCSSRMIRSDQPAAMVSVDACATHGTWFDAGELQKVMRVRESVRRRNVVQRPTFAAGPGYSSGEERDPEQTNAIIDELVKLMR
jgi:Zn-finger nucleic acid-binding protein